MSCLEPDDIFGIPRIAREPRIPSQPAASGIPQINGTDLCPIDLDLHIPIERLVEVIIDEFTDKRK